MEYFTTSRYMKYGRFRMRLSQKEVGLLTRIFYIMCVTLAILHVYVSVSFFMIPESYISGRNLILESTMSFNTGRENSKNVVAYEVQRQFPRWGEAHHDELQNGIDVEPILDFIVNSSSYTYISQQKSNKDTRYVPTTDHIDDVGAWLPETLYVIDEKGLWSSLRHRMCNAYGTGNIKTKVIPTEHAIQSAIEYLTNDTVNTCQSWPRLCNAILNDGADSATSGFPFLIYFGDFTGCNFRNYKGKYSVPLFTTAAHVDCDYAFPFPTHELLGMLRNERSEWNVFFVESQRKFPWKDKIPQVAWRGALTGPYINDTFKNPRWHLLRTVQTVKNEYVKLGLKQENFLFNVGAVRLPVRRNNKNWKNDLYEIGGLVDRIDPMERNQMYRAILDIDGNSWSSRFNLLLCYNSVVIKIEPTWVDYLQFNRRLGDVLQPWKHYIPVKSDLSDLFQKAAFAMDPMNDEVLQKMIHEANMWCRERLIKRRIDHDILDTFEQYVEYIDIGSPGWKKDKWLESKKRIFSSNSTLQMKLLTWDEDVHFGKEEADAYRIQHGLPLRTIKIET